MNLDDCGREFVGHSPLEIALRIFDCFLDGIGWLLVLSGDLLRPGTECTESEVAREKDISILSGVCCWHDRFDWWCILKGFGKNVTAS